MDNMAVNQQEGFAFIILNYNDYDTTENLVHQVEKMEIVSLIVIVDNCSTDNSYERLKELESRKVFVIRSDHNGGYGYGNNYGIEYVSRNYHYKYGIISNPDIEVTEKTIKKLYDFIVTHTETAIVAPVQRLHSSSGKILSPWKLTYLRETVLSASVAFSRLLKIDLSYDEKEILSQCFTKVDVVQGAFFAFNISTFSQIGGYDTSIFLYNEEECIAQKLKKAGKCSYIVGKEKYIHHHSVSVSKSIGRGARIKRIQLQSKMKYINMYFERISSLEKMLIRIFFAYCIIEAELINIIKSNSRS